MLESYFKLYIKISTSLILFLLQNNFPLNPQLLVMLVFTIWQPFFHDNNLSILLFAYNLSALKCERRHLKYWDDKKSHTYLVDRLLTHLLLSLNYIMGELFQLSYPSPRKMKIHVYVLLAIVTTLMVGQLTVTEGSKGAFTLTQLTIIINRW